jgi:8-oxo-dGTP pyrophosphatase MutT (NUDIX family)
MHSQKLERNRSNLLLSPQQKLLIPQNSSAAIVICNNRYLLQQRDSKSGIFFPAHWGLFGGATEEGESYQAALEREILEELSISATKNNTTHFMTMNFSINNTESESFCREFFISRLEEKELKEAKLGEGSRMQLFTAEEIFDQINMTPYDEFAIWLFMKENDI